MEAAAPEPPESQYLASKINRRVPTTINPAAWLQSQRSITRTIYGCWPLDQARCDELLSAPEFCGWEYFPAPLFGAPAPAGEHLELAQWWAHVATLLVQGFRLGGRATTTFERLHEVYTSFLGLPIWSADPDMLCNEVHMISRVLLCAARESIDRGNAWPVARQRARRAPITFMHVLGNLGMHEGFIVRARWEWDCFQDCARFEDAKSVSCQFLREHVRPMTQEGGPPECVRRLPESADDAATVRARLQVVERAIAACDERWSAGHDWLHVMNEGAMRRQHDEIERIVLLRWLRAYVAGKWVLRILLGGAAADSGVLARVPEACVREIVRWYRVTPPRNPRERLNLMSSHDMTNVLWTL